MTKLDQLAGSYAAPLAGRSKIDGQALHIGMGGHQLIHCAGFVHVTDLSRLLN